MTFFLFFRIKYFFTTFFSSENVTNLILSNMYYVKFESDKNYRFFIGEITSSKNSSKQLKFVYRFQALKIYNFYPIVTFHGLFYY